MKDFYPFIIFRPTIRKYGLEISLILGEIDFLSLSLRMNLEYDSDIFNESGFIAIKKNYFFERFEDVFTEIEFDSLLKKMDKLSLISLIVNNRINLVVLKTIPVELENNVIESKPKPKKIKTYLLKHDNELYKIGKSINPKNREKTLQAEDPNLELIHVIGINVESSFHEIFKEKRVRGEWFKLSKEDVESIINF